MSRCRGLSVSLAQGFPRVSGDEPRWDLRVGGETEFSPRERG